VGRYRTRAEIAEVGGLTQDFDEGVVAVRHSPRAG
jgi:hypothetical protein